MGSSSKIVSTDKTKIISSKKSSIFKPIHYCSNNVAMNHINYCCAAVVLTVCIWINFWRKCVCDSYLYIKMSIPTRVEFIDLATYTYTNVSTYLDIWICCKQLALCKASLCNCSRGAIFLHIYICTYLLTTASARS